MRSFTVPSLSQHSFENVMLGDSCQIYCRHETNFTDAPWDWIGTAYRAGPGDVEVRTWDLGFSSWELEGTGE